MNVYECEVRESTARVHIRVQAGTPTPPVREENEVFGTLLANVFPLSPGTPVGKERRAPIGQRVSGTRVTTGTPL